MEIYILMMWFFFVCFLVFSMVLRFELRASHLLGRYSHMNYNPGPILFSDFLDRLPHIFLGWTLAMILLLIPPPELVLWHLLT
jgi:hypothetical protein